MEEFILFGIKHLMMMAVGLGAVALLLALGFFIPPKALAKLVSVLVLVTKILELYYRHNILGEEITNMLPFHLCNLSIILAVFMLFFHSNLLFQLIYFWFAGAIFAIVTPELSYDFPNFFTISFFVTHFYLIFSALFALIHFGFRPSLKGLVFAFCMINIWAVLMYFVNLRLGTNYLYVNRLPGATTILSFLGAWPYYLLPVEMLYLLISFLLYLPFRSRRRKFYLH